MPDGAAMVYQPPYAVAGIRTVGSVAPTWDLLKGALPTELLRRGSLRLLNGNVA